MLSNAFGLNNVKAKYEMNGDYLEEVIEERDLGVILQSDLKCSNAILAAAHRRTYAFNQWNVFTVDGKAVDLRRPR